MLKAASRETPVLAMASRKPRERLETENNGLANRKMQGKWFYRAV